MGTRQPIVPETVCDQVRLWESERHRVKLDPGVLYEQFPTADAFKARKVSNLILIIFLVVLALTWAYLESRSVCKKQRISHMGEPSEAAAVRVRGKSQ